MVYKCHNMGSFKLHTIKTDKFKNVRMEIFFRNNIDKLSIVKRTILFELLLESSKKYKNKRDIMIKCEELYNATLYTQTSKVGNEVVSSVVMDFLNPKYPKAKYLSEAIKLPFDIIFEPAINDEEFNKENLETVKLRMKAEIKSLKENPRNYTILNALKAMDSTSPSSISLLGNDNDVDKITSSNLVSLYHDILEHDYVDVFIIGDIDFDEVIDLVNKYQHFNTIKNHELKLYVDNKVVRKKKIVKKKEKFSQDYIVYILNITNLSHFESAYVMHIFNHILGGPSLDTKLYKKLRGEHSLCYNVSSLYHKYDRLMLISTSVDHENVNLSKKLIEEVINSMKIIDDSELNNAKKAIISSITTSFDSPSGIISNYYFHDFADLDPIEDRIDNYNKITIKDLVGVVKKLKVNTIYISEGDSNE